MTVELHTSAVGIIKSKYNILASADCRNLDGDFTGLVKLLESVKRDTFLPNEKILLVHMDTDYYDELLPCGLLIINLIRAFKDANVPFFPLLFVTNHYGIKKEFDLLLKDHPLEDRPIIIETLLSSLMLTDQIDCSTNLSLDQINKAGLCMMGVRRSHRVALCNFLSKNSLLDVVALKTNFKLGKF